ncbi:hybrid sensor histidine kinase/response regulator [Neosynechococcus sphagnicola]|uniref:hybrid sensor histidine kinase/response regulator n=1 Tax=Neosynechococcus sphagnicola TaxID=1501145 RepID=UPI003084432A
MLEALQEGRSTDQAVAYELLTLGVEQVSDLIAAARSGAQIIQPAPSLSIYTALKDYLGSLPSATPASMGAVSTSTVNPLIVKTILEEDLETCLQRVEALLTAPTPVLQQALSGLVEECNLLGQTLGLPWLVETADVVRQSLSQSTLSFPEIGGAAIAQLRELRDQTLSPPPPVPPTLAPPTLAPPTPEPVLGNDPPVAEMAVAVTLNLRIPVTRLNRMNNTLGELLISHERLTLYQAQLNQASRALKKQAQQLPPINEQVRVFYDQLATAPSLDATAAMAEATEFDPLQLDRYTAFHSTLQDFQELMVQVQETRADVDLITRDFQEGLEQLRQQLDSLRRDLTESRLVPFRFLAERFITPLQTLSQRHQKAVTLEVVGKETLVDQAILEQLQTPLTHLLRNAFDHGIESLGERQALHKPETARITLSARMRGNQVMIAIADDGRGIDLQKVYERAVSMGLCQVPRSQLTPAQILEFLFLPGFSTATAVTDLSGRGVGLDVVRLQVERLRGFVQVESQWQQGSQFTLTIPLTLSILPLLLCRSQQRTLAIPSINILEIIALSEFYDADTMPSAIVWQQQLAPLYSLVQLLPYSHPQVTASSSQRHQLGLVLDTGDRPLVVAVDSLLGERELVLKPFDTTVKVPPYVAGCTVLGTGEVVPVLSPVHFVELLQPTTPVVEVESLETVGAAKELPSANLTAAQPAVLVVDDSVAVRRLLDRILNRSGYRVVQCRDGKEALEELNRAGEHCSLVISDIEMPRMDGFALLREIRAHPRLSKLPVAMLTSRENDQHRTKARDLGATMYFTKPFQPNDLLRAIAQLLA